MYLGITMWIPVNQNTPWETKNDTAAYFSLNQCFVRYCTMTALQHKASFIFFSFWLMVLPFDELHYQVPSGHFQSRLVLLLRNGKKEDIKGHSAISDLGAPEKSGSGYSVPVAVLSASVPFTAPAWWWVIWWFVCMVRNFWHVNCLIEGYEIKYT